ncbi:hypothetical protein POM88_042048 [Heracleum sosnowskyi]|uniref:Uncharacterized protein n=1 Tax=Heracleum sosnowskyi TaxID=360622 RepID=A0AAD8HFI9_9APIA|nr:hypothetical protein POM88_042048 [Heracleum sosnowskyi]
MAYGFKIDWSKIFCARCNLRAYSFCQALNADYTCFYDCDLYDMTTDAFLPLCWRQNLDGISEILKGNRFTIAAVAGLILAARFTIGLPFLGALLIYRSKKRHLSVQGRAPVAHRIVLMIASTSIHGEYSCCD